MIPAEFDVAWNEHTRAMMAMRVGPAGSRARRTLQKSCRRFKGDLSLVGQVLGRDAMELGKYTGVGNMKGWCRYLPKGWRLTGKNAARQAVRQGGREKIATTKASDPLCMGAAFLYIGQDKIDDSQSNKGVMGSCSKKS